MTWLLWVVTIMITMSQIALIRYIVNSQNAIGTYLKQTWFAQVTAAGEDQKAQRRRLLSKSSGMTNGKKRKQICRHAL